MRRTTLTSCTSGIVASDVSANGQIGTYERKRLGRPSRPQISGGALDNCPEVGFEETGRATQRLNRLLYNRVVFAVWN
jgi:hypothetical protein